MIQSTSFDFVQVFPSTDLNPQRLFFNSHLLSGPHFDYYLITGFTWTHRDCGYAPAFAAELLLLLPFFVVIITPIWPDNNKQTLCFSYQINSRPSHCLDRTTCAATEDGSILRGQWLLEVEAGVGQIQLLPVEEIIFRHLANYTVVVWLGHLETEKG